MLISINNSSKLIGQLERIIEKEPNELAELLVKLLLDKNVKQIQLEDYEYRELRSLLYVEKD